jgi:hypothetical protein
VRDLQQVVERLELLLPVAVGVLQPQLTVLLRIRLYRK